MKVKKISFLVILLSSIYLLPTLAFAESDLEMQNQKENAVLLHESDQEVIEVYEDKTLKDFLQIIPDDTNVTLLESNSEWAFIEFLNEEELLSRGYVYSDYVYPLDEADEYRHEREQTVEEEDLDESENTATKSGSDTENKDESKSSETKSENAAEQVEGQKISQQLSQAKQIRGIALKSTTNVYAQMSTNSEVLRSYNKGHILRFRPHNSEWYSAVVIINGERQSGFIYKNDVEEIKQEQDQLYGFAIRSVEVYSSATRNASVLKSYRQGSGLKYRSFTSEWYEATVYVNGKPHTGYIHVSAVANRPPTDSSERLKGVAANTGVAVHSERSKNSSILKSYKGGHILIYRPYDSNWYEATVKVNGTWHTGYIHSNDVETATLNSETLHGIGKANPTRVYASGTKSSRTLKGYQQGHVLKYRSFSENWYEATVKVNGKWRTGYIHVGDVETASSTSETLNGIGVKNPTRVYDKASTNARALKSYRQGHVLKYRTFTPNWYEATVKVKGKWRTGYIHRSHVENITKAQERVEGFAMKQQTKAYSRASRTSSTLKNYSFGSNLIYRTYTKNWYEATVYVSGKAHKAYFHKNDVSIRNNKVIVLDAGHGGSDPGAVGNGLREKDITLDIVKRTEKLLKEKGFTVIMTRSSDKSVSLKERTDIANRAKADLFISIHVNAGGGTGIETWWYNKGANPQKSKALATNIQNELIKETGAQDRGIKNGNLHINRESDMPSALVETGFIDSTDVNKLRQNNYKQKIVKGIVLGIIKYFS